MPTDYEFSINNTADPTKVLFFDVSGIQTDTLTTAKMPSISVDSVTWAFLEAVNTWTGSNTFTADTLISEAGLAVGSASDYTSSFIAFRGTSFEIGVSIPDPTAQRSITLPDYSGMLIPRIASGDYPTQTANLGSTTVYTTTAAGMYRVSIYAVVQSVMGGNLTITYGWTDPKQAQSATLTLLLAAGTTARSAQSLYCATGTAITIATSGYVSGTYDLWVRVEAVG